jgi:hypothetical protein
VQLFCCCSAGSTNAFLLGKRTDCLSWVSRSSSVLETLYTSPPRSSSRPAAQQMDKCRRCHTARGWRCVQCSVILSGRNQCRKVFVACSFKLTGGTCCLISSLLPAADSLGKCSAVQAASAHLCTRQHACFMQPTTPQETGYITVHHFCAAAVTFPMLHHTLLLAACAGSDCYQCRCHSSSRQLREGARRRAFSARQHVW